MIILKGKEAREFERKMKLAGKTKITESEKKRLEDNYLFLLIFAYQFTEKLGVPKG